MPPLVKAASGSVAKASFSWLPATSLFIKFGQSDVFNNSWFGLAKLGFLLTVRQSLIKKTRHDVSRSKTTQFHVKTEKYGAFKGHLIIPTEWVPVTKPVALPPGERSRREVMEMEFKDNHGHDERVFVTYERQDLRFVQTQIIAGKYKLLDCVLHNIEGKVASAEIYVEDENKRKICIRIWESELKPQEDGMIPDVKTLKAVFENKNDKKYEMADSRRKRALDKLFRSDLWRDNINSTAKVLPAELVVDRTSRRDSKRVNNARASREIVLKWIVDDIPTVVCDSAGIPIKGDIDQRNCIVPMSVPLSSLELIDINPRDENLIPKLIDKINRLYREFARQGYDEGFLAVIANAVTVLEDHYKANASDLSKRNEIITMMGNIELINAVLVLGLDSVIEHGSDAVSIFLPENYQIEHIADEHSDIVHETYGEFDYYAFMLAHEEMFADKLINFNITEFTKTTQYLDPNTGKPTTREDVNVTVTDNEGVVRNYNNCADEDLSIKLHILLYERQLLQLNLKDNSKFREYIRVEEHNYEKMHERAIASGQTNLAKALYEGMRVKKGIINSVKDLNPDVMMSRLAEIRELSNIASGASLSATSPKAALPVSDPQTSPRTISPRILAKQKSYGDLVSLAKQESFKGVDKKAKYNEANLELRLRLENLLPGLHMRPIRREF